MIVPGETALTYSAAAGNDVGVELIVRSFRRLGLDVDHVTNDVQPPRPRDQRPAATTDHVTKTRRSRDRVRRLRDGESVHSTAVSDTPT